MVYGASSFNWWWVAWRGQAQNGGNFLLFNSIWLSRSRSIAPQNNKDLCQVVFHLWSEFGDPSLNGSQVIAGTTSDWYTHTGTQIDAGNDNTRRPKMISHDKGDSKQHRIAVNICLTWNVPAIWTRLSSIIFNSLCMHKPMFIYIHPSVIPRLHWPIMSCYISNDGVWVQEVPSCVLQLQLVTV